MFKEIESELLSILSDDPIEKIAHMPTKELAKTLDLLFHIKFDTVERVYTSVDSGYTRHAVIYKSEESDIIHDTCLVNGSIRHIMIIPSKAFSMNDNNAKEICKNIIQYITIRIALLINAIPLLNDRNIANRVCSISIPVITCDIMRKLYGGAALSTIIYNELVEKLSSFKEVMTVEGIDNILNLLEEDLSLEILLDNSFIYAIKDDKKYTGIWSKE